MAKKFDGDDVKIDKAILYEAALLLLNSVELQLSYIDETNVYSKYKLLDMLTALGRPNHFKERIKWAPMDRWENATGEFGLAPTNPIMVDDSIGYLSYLSHLRWDGKPVVFFGGGMSNDAVMGAHVFSLDGKHLDELHFDVFHRYQSKSVPRGYTWAEKADGLTGTICVIQEKFADTVDLIYRDAVEMFDVAAVSPHLSKFDVEAASRTWEEYKRSSSRG